MAFVGPVGSTALRRRVVRSCAVPKPAPAAAAVKTDIKDGIKMARGFNLPETIPEEGIESAVKLMKSGDLFRYNRNDPFSEVSFLEVELSEYTGHRYCVALNSCGSAIFLGLMAAGVQPGDKVFANALTFTAVPSAVHHAGAQCVMVESNTDYVMDVADFEKKIKANQDVKYLLLSHMRGKVTDLDAVARICKANNITIIEDCAHSLGVKWRGKHTGHIGKCCCVSSQSYKMLNSGEGGFLLTNDDMLAAKVIGYAGGYEKLFLKHVARPDSSVFAELDMRTMPNFSLRMHNLTAAVLRPQIKNLEQRVTEANRRYNFVTERLMAGIAGTGIKISLPFHDERMRPCNDSLQFNLLNITENEAARICELCKERGVPLSLFGSAGNARNFRTWQYLYDEKDTPNLEQTKNVIAFAADVRLPPQFTDDEFAMLVRCIHASFKDLQAERSKVRQ
eukprot:Plantae.Rhodophyta-Purpureofilum_apyrenoidigerum.ctg2859.p1 GENE.Plantae.Rhodophyta-Purpureofilum_apyrenoidigerum.ctg2859~~Plantae.Rhodophyta-Purpureofilum_apyrenoidigerum.ctg2859.p1  ORF type:complete len:487 (-),score=84.19 Plantae.Rhodophyta-Purpureofilum_apyrenoidigerum.ctg2859:809-2158(-)